MELDRKKIKQYFYNNKEKFVELKNETEWSSEEEQIYHYSKEQNETDLTKKDVENWTDIIISVPPKSPPNFPNWPLIISLIVAGIILLVGITIFIKKRKR